MKKNTLDKYRNRIIGLASFSIVASILFGLIFESVGIGIVAAILGAMIQALCWMLEEVINIILIGISAIYKKHFNKRKEQL